VNTATIVIVLVAWIVVGMLTGLWMARRGHDPLWVVIGAVFGPLFVPVAIERVQRRPELGVYGQKATVAPRSDATPGLRVLIGLDGSPESERALSTFLQLLGPYCGHLVLAEVVRFESAEYADRAEVDAATQRLTTTASGVQNSGTVEIEVLAGAPGPTLRLFAVHNDIDIIVAGRRGQGLSTRLVGSASADLVERSTVPVLVL